MRLRSVAFGNLRRRSSRSAFLVAGLLIGIATVVTLLTLSRALTVQAQNQLETYGANIVVAPRTDDLSLTYGGVALGGVRLQARDLREADLARITSIPNRKNIAIVAPELLGAVEVRGRKALLLGVRSGAEFRLKRWWRVVGRPPAAGDELVAGSSAARRFGIAIGDRVTLDGRDFTVTGVLKPTGSQDDDLLITDLGAAQTLLGKPGRVTLVQVAALCSDCPVEEIAAQLGEVLPGTKVTAMQQVTKNRMHALDVFRTFSYVVAGVIIAIEALVVFVTMMGSVNARTREIGIFRALGFRRAHVTGLILIEAGVASALAGVLGYLAGMALSYALLPFFAEGLGVSISWTPLLAAGAVAARAAHRRRWARCTRRCTRAASTRPSPFARSEPEPRMTLRTIAFSNLRRRKARAAFLIAGLFIGVGTVVALLTLTRSMSGADRGQHAELRRQHRGHASQQGRRAQLRGHRPSAASPWAAAGWTRRTSSASRRSRRASSVAVVAPELVGAVQVKGRRALLMGVDPDAAVRAQALVVGRPRTAAEERPTNSSPAPPRLACSACRWATTCASAASASPSPASCDRPARRTTTCSSPTWLPSRSCSAGPASSR